MTSLGIPNPQLTNIQATSSTFTPTVQITSEQKTVQICNDLKLLIGPKQVCVHRISVPWQATNAIVRGSFQACGGNGNDIVVFVMTEIDFVKWRNKHEAQAFYLSGRVTAGQINVKLPSEGSYCLVFSNKFSSISSKVLTAKVDLIYNL